MRGAAGSAFAQNPAVKGGGDNGQTPFIQAAFAKATNVSLANGVNVTLSYSGLTTPVGKAHSDSALPLAHIIKFVK